MGKPSGIRHTGPTRFTFPDGELGTWAALGDVTDRSVRVWLRHPGGGPQRAVLRTDGEVLGELELHPDPDRDHVAAGTLESIQPVPDGRFTVNVAGLTREGRFAPAAGTPARFSFAFGSCHQPFQDTDEDGKLERHPGARIYPRMDELLTREDARFLLSVGDQVYSDAITAANVREQIEHKRTPDEELVETYRHLYRGYFNERGMRSIVERRPSYLTWDDHDIFEGWGSQMYPNDLDRRLYRAAEQTYREYQHLRNPGAGLDDRPPFSYRFWYGDVGFFVLDLRGCRDYQAGRILGDQQWAALDAFLAEADEREAPSVFIAASVPVVHISPALAAALQWIPTSRGTDVRDRWTVDKFRPEREALLGRLFEWQTARPRRRVAILSGDVHVGASIRIRQRRGPGRIVQWTSSAFTTPILVSHRFANWLGTALVRLGEHSISERLEGLVPHNNFGLVTVTPRDGGGHDLSFRIYAYDSQKDRVWAALESRTPLPSSRRDGGRGA